MNIKIYVVRLGGKLYIQDALYNLYQATTKDVTRAHFFTDEAKAEKMAKKARGEVVALTLSDGEDDSELELVKKERDKAVRDFEGLKTAFKKIMGQND